MKCQPGKRLEFTVLLGGLGVAVLDEFGPQRVGEAVGGDELGFQNMMEIEGFAVGGLLREAEGAVAFAVEVLPGPVDGHGEAPEDPPGVQGLHPNEALGDLGGEFREGGRIERLQVVDDGIVVRGGLGRGAGDGVEVGDEGGRVRLEAELPPGAQTQEEDRDGGPDQVRLGIVHVVRVAMIGETLDLPRQVRHKMADRLGEHGP
jgi:hypothetical protein